MLISLSCISNILAVYLNNFQKHFKFARLCPPLPTTYPLPSSLTPFSFSPLPLTTDALTPLRLPCIEVGDENNEMVREREGREGN